jgi:RNase adaptor protein for sRNA GlmZ degradation
MDRLVDKVRESNSIKFVDVKKDIRISISNNGFSYFILNENGRDKLLFIETEDKDLIKQFENERKGLIDVNNLDYARLQVAPIVEMSKNGIVPNYIMELELKRK